MDKSSPSGGSKEKRITVLFGKGEKNYCIVWKRRWQDADRQTKMKKRHGRNKGW